jgi:hypothetical protein
MHGLINRSFQCFLRDTYGVSLWATVAEAAGLPAEGFEAMMNYDDGLTYAVLAAASNALAKPRDALLEDMGSFLVSIEPLRRLLRFGGVDYVDFLYSLDELPDRVRLALPDLDLPNLTLAAISETRFELTIHTEQPGYVPAFVGILRAMADDYGALALIDTGESVWITDKIGIELLQNRFASGRSFDLTHPEVA